MLEAIIEAYLISMSYIWPEGLTNPHQHRDTIRVFLMGWAEHIKYSDNKEDMQKYIDETRHITETNWFPDVRWVWWKYPNPENN